MLKAAWRRRRVLQGTMVALMTSTPESPSLAGSRMSHTVLLGDSIFANAAYVAGGPDVVTQVRAVLPGGQGRATLRAVDGAVIGDVSRQLVDLPRDATALVLSIGGNHALRQAGVLERKAGSGAEA